MSENDNAVSDNDTKQRHGGKETDDDMWLHVLFPQYLIDKQRTGLATNQLSIESQKNKHDFKSV